ncbi:MAG: 50S ribosomal protein L4 [Candidatus Nanoarchaeia archaeon]|nr:50S ribosomal protein L4 [Candidatus Nanoarchaeia archaeon]
MNADILSSTTGKELKKIALPEQFKEEYRPDLIKKAVVAYQSSGKTPYGADPLAGLRKSSFWHKRRQKKWRTTYTHGISRTPKKVLGRPGGGWANVMRFHMFRGATAPHTVGGRRAFPPQADKDILKRINKKENNKAICSAISASALPKIVELRSGYKNVPVIFESKIESIDKTAKFEELLKKLGMENLLEKASEKKVRAGKGKTRGRRYKKKIGPLVVVSENCPLLKSARNIAGVDSVKVDRLNPELLAPGTHAGRIVIWSEKAVEKMKEKRLYL